MKRRVVLALLALLLTACALEAGGLAGTPASTPPQTAVPTAIEPTATLGPSSTPTLQPSATPIPSPTATRGPEAYYRRLIVIDQDAQMMYVYQNGAKIRSIPVSTGKPDQESTFTPAWEGDVGRYVGTFFAFGTYADEAWYLFEHYGAMLIHGAPYIKQDGVKVYQELDALGVRPMSHGCIRLPPDEAKWLTAWGPQGAHVIIRALTRKL
jgi:lipoprotein-anchoring transpeptidase ErfK/SrfK